ncbi:MAG: type II toxin-antitoxin system VapC family toxin [SAR202 cluster bacterium]|nr:type II toxin-antitoxin system VapC family toxin [SAR202 cluster bacterium]
MTTARFLDTNILLRYFSGDDKTKAEKALALLMRVERGDERVETSVVVVCETIFTLTKSYGVTRSEVKRLLAPILQMKNFNLVGKAVCLDALDVFESNNVSFADAFNAVYMKSRGMTEVYSWDSDFDRLEGVTRVSP